MLTQDTLKEVIYYTPTTGETTWTKAVARKVRVGTSAGYFTKSGTKCLRLKKQEHPISRLAWLYTYGKFPDRSLYHFDGDKTNLCISNIKQVIPPLIGDITQSYLKQCLQYDERLGEFYWKTVITSGAQKIGERASYSSGMGYRSVIICGKAYLMHVLVWIYTHGRFPVGDIDHINHVRNDNRLCNLREVSRSDNLRNARMKSNNTSGTTGVMWSKVANKWVASIYVQGKTKHLGTFETIDAAIESRRIAEVKYKFHLNHGQNIIDAFDPEQVIDQRQSTLLKNIFHDSTPVE